VGKVDLKSRNGRLPEGEDLPTETLDLSCLLTDNVTLTGSFDLRSVHARSLTRLLDSLPMPALLVDQDRKIVFSNECWGRTLGQFEKLRGHLFEHLFPDPNQAALVQALFQQCFQDRKPRIRKLALVSGGKQIWGRMHLRSVRLVNVRYILVLYEDLTAEREQLALVTRHAEALREAYDLLEQRVDERTAELTRTNDNLVREIGERKRTEEALRQSESNYRAIFDAANDAIIVAELSTCTILDANLKTTETFGYTLDEARGLRLSDLASDEFSTAGNDMSRLAQLAGEGGPQIFEWMARDKHGRPFRAEVNLKRGCIGGQDRLLAVVRDVTERRQLEEQLRQAQKMEAVGRLAGGVAHDFNNLLTTIIGYANLLSQSVDQEGRDLDKVNHIIQASDKAARLTRQLLAFSRRQVLEVKVLDLNGVIADMEAALRGLVGESISVITVLEPSIGPVRADPRQIEQILVNLALNARDAMPGGGELIIETCDVNFDESACRIDPELRPGPYVMIAVSDTGRGMYPEVVSRIFEPFFSTKGSKNEGSGLGLAMVYGVVKQHQGYISVRSRPELGTTFKLFWPAYRDPEDEGPEPASQAPLGGTETILIVEDENQVRELMCEILRTLGFTVCEAGDGVEAIRVSELHPGPIHLLLTDVVMPKMNGATLYSRLSKLRSEMKALFVSGYTENAIVHHGVLKPGVHFLQKPFTADRLANKVREALDSPE
jgi:two-component system, cell cycle sensor histidine kinase and response regulator CckA